MHHRTSHTDLAQQPIHKASCLSRVFYDSQQTNTPLPRCSDARSRPARSADPLFLTAPASTASSLCCGRVASGSTRRASSGRVRHCIAASSSGPSAALSSASGTCSCVSMTSCVASAGAGKPSTAPRRKLLWAARRAGKALWIGASWARSGTS